MHLKKAVANSVIFYSQFSDSDAEWSQLRQENLFWSEDACPVSLENVSAGGVGGKRDVWRSPEISLCHFLSHCLFWIFRESQTNSEFGINQFLFQSRWNRTKILFSPDQRPRILSSQISVQIWSWRSQWDGTFVCAVLISFRFQIHPSLASLIITCFTHHGYWTRRMFPVGIFKSNQRKCCLCSRDSGKECSNWTIFDPRLCVNVHRCGGLFCWILSPDFNSLCKICHWCQRWRTLARWGLPFTVCSKTSITWRSKFETVDRGFPFLAVSPFFSIVYAAL